MDGSTSYGQTLKFPGVEQRIRESLGPEVRVIFMVRDPLARIASGFVELASEWTRSVPAEISACMNELVEPTLYRTHIEAYERVLGRDNVAVLSLEDTLKSPAPTLERLIQWLKLEPAPLALPALNRMESKALPPTWMGHWSIRWTRGSLARMPPRAREALAVAIKPRLARSRPSPRRAQLGWDDLGSWATQVRDEALWCVDRLGSDPGWPSLCSLGAGENLASAVANPQSA
jgi:hypothetical protein